MYLVSHRNSSSKNGAVLNVVDQEAGVVKHLNDVANLANLQNNVQLPSEYRTSPIGLFSIQMPFKYQTIWHPTYFRPI